MVNFKLKNGNYDAERWAYSGLEFGDAKVKAPKDEEKSRQTTKKLEVHPSKNVKLREQKASVRAKDNLSTTTTTTTTSNMKPKNADDLEEWTRIRNMERRREIQSLKQQNLDLKKELDVVQELLVKKKGQVDALKKSVNRDHGPDSQDSSEEAKQNINRLKTLETTYTELQQKHQLLLKEKEEILSSLQKVKMEKENAEKKLEALKKEKEEQTLELQQTSEELEKGKKEIENLYKMYESMLNDKESERLSIENENKILLRDLMVRCKSVESINSPRASIHGSIDLDSDTEESTEIPREEMIELIANLEFEKGQKEEELEKVKNELESHKALCEQFHCSADTSSHDDNQKELFQQLSSKDEILQERQEKINKLELSLKVNADRLELLENQLKLSEEEPKKEIENLKKAQREDKETIVVLQRKLEEIQKLLNKKNKEIVKLSTLVDEYRIGTVNIQRELQTSFCSDITSTNSNLTSSEPMNNTSNELTQRLLQKDDQHRAEMDRIISEYQNKVKILEEELSQTRQQKEDFENIAEKLQEQLSLLKMQLTEQKIHIERHQQSADSTLPAEPIPVDANLQKQSISNASLLEKLHHMEDELVKVRVEKQLLEKNLETLKGDSTNMEKQLKAEMNEYQKYAELQEDLISKAEYDNKKLEKRVQEFNENVIDLEEKLRQYTKENLALVESLDHEKQQHETLKVNFDSIATSQGKETEMLLQCREEELDEYKNRLESQEIRYEALLKDKEDEISTLEKQIANVQNELELKLKELKLASAEHEKFKRKTTENDRILRDEQEAYLINEIERQQSEFKSQIAAAERDKEKHIYQLTQHFEEKMIDLEVEYDQIKSNEIEILKDDHNTRLSLITMQRDELLETIKKLESLLLQQKWENKEQLEIFQEIVQRKNDELIELQIKETSQNQLIQIVAETITDEKRKHVHSNTSNNKEIINLLERLEKKLKEEKTTRESSTPLGNGYPMTDANTTWPPSNSSSYHPSTQRLSLDSLKLQPSALQEQIEKTKAEISTRITELNEQLTLEINKGEQLRALQTPYWNDSVDGCSSICSDELLQSSINGSIPENNFQNISDYFSPPSPVSPSINQFKDSGITECSTPSSLYKNQLQMVAENFSKLEKQCLELNKNNSGIRDNEQWYKDLEVWKQDVNSRLEILRRRISKNEKSESHDDISVTAFPRSIIFRPTSSEVKDIIESVNKKYERFTDEY